MATTRSRVGIEIVRNATQMPLRQIAENAGEDGAVIAGKVLDNDEYNFGFDAQTGEFKDLVKAGIIDPTKVVRVALQNAASVAGLLITTEAMVSERPDKAAGTACPAEAAWAATWISDPGPRCLLWPTSVARCRSMTHRPVRAGGLWEF